jgi:hypothetical protein
MTEKKRIQTIKDCETFTDMKEGIENIINQYVIMQSRVNNDRLTYLSCIEALKWFLDPVESKGRKDD